MKIGAIRWDAWVGDKNPVGLEVEKTMLSTYAKKRYPFYASNLKGNLHIRCDSKDIITKEIDYAYRYGIDYFAFCWYPFHSGLDMARNLFLTIKQDKVKWCMILGTNPMEKEDALWLISQFVDERYQKVDGRPVVYLFDVNEKLLSIVSYIRRHCKQYMPYFIGLVWNEKQALAMNQMFNLDAISQYCTPGQDNMEYSKVSAKEIGLWNQYLKVNQVIPWITTGWDKRPRYEFPVSWEDCSSFSKEYIQAPSCEQLKQELLSAIDFSKRNSSPLLLIYAWNEFDEGGFIAPILKIDGKINCDKFINY